MILLLFLPKRVGVSSEHVKIVFGDDACHANVSFKTVQTELSGYITEEEYALRRAFHPEGSEYGNTLFEEVQRYAEQAKLIAQEEEFDVIHAHDWLSFLAGIKAKEVSGKPLVTHVHCDRI